MRIDPQKSLEKVDAAIAADPNPRHRAMLQNFREHLLAELEGDVERIMKTQVDEPLYQFWGSGIGDFGPKGGEQVKGFYRHIFEEGYNKLYSYRSAAIFKYDAAGRCLGEDTYSDGNPTLERVRKLGPEELPDGLRGRERSAQRAQGERSSSG